MNTTSAQPTRDVLAAYEAGDHPRNVRHLSAHMRAASAEHLSAHGRPLRRMAGPGGLHRSGTETDGRNTVPVWLTDKGVVMSVPGAGLAPTRVTAEQVKAVLGSPRFLLMPLTPRAAMALESAVGRGGSDEAASTAQHVGVLRRLTASSKMLVLSTALARAFWTPAGTEADDVTAWAAALGTSDDPDGWRELARHALTSADDHRGKHTDEHGMVTAREYAVQIQNIEDKMDPAVLGRRSATSAASAFSMATSVDEHWSAICRTDELLVPYYLRTGEVVEVSDRAWVGSSVHGSLSAPSKVKCGDVLVMLGRRIADVNLADLGYDDETETLIGVFGTRTTDPRAGRRLTPAKRAVLHDLAEHRGRVFITAAPYGAMTSASTALWSRADETTMNPLASLNMPVDLAVAGAPVE